MFKCCIPGDLPKQGWRGPRSRDRKHTPSAPASQVGRVPAPLGPWAFAISPGGILEHVTQRHPRSAALQGSAADPPDGAVCVSQGLWKPCRPYVVAAHRALSLAMCHRHCGKACGQHELTGSAWCPRPGLCLLDALAGSRGAVTHAGHASPPSTPVVPTHHPDSGGSWLWAGTA